MKAEIHPKLHEATITCTCGTVYNTFSTVQNIRVGICAGCHPFFTGEQRLIDTAGRIDKFSQRYGGSTARRGKLKLGASAS
jgi:large subunit ribosomal protein L31